MRDLGAMGMKTHPVPRRFLLAMGLAVAALATTASAAQLHVRPISIELVAPAQASKIVLTNRGRTPIAAQARLFRWTQKNGQDVLERTRVVVASPPLLKLRPGREHVVRIVRLAKTPVKGEESYRLIVDEIPQKRLKGSGVVFALRYSIPVFFRQQGATPARLSWQARRGKGGVLLKATNTGQLHERISNLRLVLPGGRTLVIARGLAGYVLGNSTRIWRVPRHLKAGARLTIRGTGLHGPFRTTIRVR